MYLPTEILMLIIREAVETLPFEDLLRTRLVNSFFAKEILDCLFRSPRLDTEIFCLHTNLKKGLCFKSPGWLRFPLELKRQYVYYKLERDRQKSYLLSRVLDGLLSIAHKPRTPEEEASLVDEIIDTWLRGGRCCPYHTLFNHPEGSRGHWKSERCFEHELEMIMASCAIYSGDTVNLQGILDAHASHFNSEPEYGYADFCRLPTYYDGGKRLLRVASRVGSAEIMGVFIKNLDNLHTFQLSPEWIEGSFLESTALESNWTGLKTWIDSLECASDNELLMRLRPAIRGAIKVGEFDTIDLMRKELEGKLDIAGWSFEVLMQAINLGNIDAVQYALGGDPFKMDINMQRNNYNHAPLFQALFECPTESRPAILKLLLDNGADVHQLHWKTGRTALESAAAKGDRNAARVIVEYEVKGPGPQSFSSFSQGRKSILLRNAVDYRCVPIIEYILEPQQCLSFLRRGTTYTVKRKGVTDGNAERIWGEIGRGEDVRYLVTVHQD